MTMTSSSITNKKKPMFVKTTPTSAIQLPDIIPSPSTPIQSVSMIELNNNPINTDIHVGFIHMNKSFMKSSLFLILGDDHIY
jgi:hypothetical protein